MLLNHDNLINYYRTNFTLMHVHKWNLVELKEMMPWERILYIDLLKDYTKREDEMKRDIQTLHAREARKVGKPTIRK